MHMRSTFLHLLGIAAFLLAVQVTVLWLVGQPFVCSCGVVKLWESSVWSIGNSQQLFDWYTFSHIGHGFIFYAAFWFLFPRMSVAYRLALSLGLEVSWELLENTPWVIQAYRQQALAAGYNGDSILNSLSDSFSMTAGFLLAWRLPPRITLAIGLFMEVFTVYMVRDGLLLNLLNFIHQFDFISAWQNGAQR